AQVFQRVGRYRQGLPQGFEPGVYVAVAGLDQAVGVEGEQAALRQVHFEGLEGQSAQAQRGPGGQVQKFNGAIRVDHGRWGVSGAGEGAAAGYRVVDRVQAGGADVRRHGPARAVVCFGFDGQPDDQVVELGEELVRGEVDVGEGAHGGTEP